MSISSRQIVGYTALAVGVGGIIYLLNNKKKNEVLVKKIIDILDGKAEDPSNTKLEGQVIVKQNEIDKLPNGNYPLKIKDKNKKVLALQKLLNQNYGSNLDEDGKFGVGTYDVLCDKYWNWCGSSVGLYKRTISQSDVDEIRRVKR